MLFSTDTACSFSTKAFPCCETPFSVVLVGDSSAGRRMVGVDGDAQPGRYPYRY